MTICNGTKRDGDSCTASALTGEQWCYNHHPDYAEERRRSASHAATIKHSSVAQELREIREVIWELLGVLISDRLPYKVRKELQSIVQLLQCYLRAAELEMREAERPLEANLDVAGLKEQVLERIATLEEQEREREELLAGVAALAKEHGFDLGPLKAVMGR
jgi:hypothetical protein